MPNDRKRRRVAAWSAIALCAWAAPRLPALWMTDPGVNQPIVQCSLKQENPVAIDDGAGGMIVVWEDTGAGGYDIRAQRFNAAGVAQWGACGALATASDAGQTMPVAGDQRNPSATSDSNGGVIIGWVDFRDGAFDVYSQRLNAAGATQWTAGGVKIYDDAGFQFSSIPRPRILAEPDGGAAFLFNAEVGAGNGVDIHLQRLTAAGGVRLVTNGAPVATGAADQLDFEALRKSDGQIILLYEDNREGGGKLDLYVQRITTFNSLALGGLGVALVASAGDQHTPRLVDMGSGQFGAVYDDDGTDAGDIRAQAFDADGTAMWAGAWTTVAAASGMQSGARAASNPQGDLIVVWEDRRFGAARIFAERFDFSGSRLWGILGGIQIASGAAEKLMPRVVEDGARGAIVSWSENDGSFDHLYWQRVLDSAQVPFNFASQPLSVVAGRNADQHQLLRLSGGTVAGVWRDSRNGLSNTDVFGQRIDPPEPPSVSITGGLNVSQGGPSAMGAVAMLSDPAQPPGDLVMMVTDSPAGLTFSATNSAGTVTATAQADCSLAPGTYAFEIEVRNDVELVAKGSFDVVVSANPTPTIGAYTNTTLVAGDSAGFSPSSAPADANSNLVTVEVSPTTLPGSGTISVNAGTGVVTVVTTPSTPPGTTNVTVTLTDSCGAQAQANFDLVVAPPPPLTVNAGPDLTSCAGSSVQLQATAGGGLPPYTYLWSPAGTLNNPALANPTATPSAQTIYSVTVTDALNSNAVATVTVTPTSALVYVDFSHVGTESGSMAQPFNTLAEGVAAVCAGGTLRIAAGTSAETATISKALRLESAAGTVVIGRAP